jgi:hypothetical protein
VLARYCFAPTELAPFFSSFSNISSLRDSDVTLAILLSGEPQHRSQSTTFIFVAGKVSGD